MTTKKTYLNIDGKRCKKPKEGSYVYTTTVKANEVLPQHKRFFVVKDGEEVFNFRMWEDTEITSISDLCKVLYDIAKSRIFSKSASKAASGITPVWYTSEIKPLVAWKKAKNGSIAIGICPLMDSVGVYPGCVLVKGELVEKASDRESIHCYFKHLPYSKYKSAARFSYRLQKLIKPKGDK